MATLVLTTVGTLVGGPIGGAIGAVLGQQIDQRLLAPRRRGPRLGDLSVQTSAYGQPIPKVFGRMRVAGTVIWAAEIREASNRSGGGKGTPKTTTYSYSADFAVALSGRPIVAVHRIWADGKLLRGAAGDWKSETGFRLYPGDAGQMVDPLIAAAEGIGTTPAYRGIAYAVFEGLQLADFGNRIPSLTFEVEAEEGAVTLAAIAGVLSDGAIGGETDATLDGYAATGDSVRSAIEALTLAMPVSITDDGERLLLSDAAGEAETISAGEIGAAAGEERGHRRVIDRRPGVETPDEIAIAYHEPARDWQAGLQRARRGGVARRIETIELPAALAAERAKALAARRLDRAWAERTEARATLPWRHLALRPGGRVRIAGDSVPGGAVPGGAAWRIEGWTIERMVLALDLKGVSAASGMPSALASPGRAQPDPDLLHGPSVVRLLDLPALDDGSGSGGAGDAPRLLIAAAGPEPGWRRATVTASLDGGASWQTIGTVDAPSVIGTAEGVLPAGQAMLVDRRSTVDVMLLNTAMWLESCTDDALAAGANAAVLGREIIQFGDAQALGGGAWRLSRLLRGRRGTEWAMADHVAGEDFVLLDRAALLSWDPPASVIGASILVQALGRGDGDAPATAAASLQGMAVRPPPPVHAHARRQANGDISITWVRRSRRGWGWIDGTDAPLGEEAEGYRIVVNGEGGLPRSFESATPAIVYTAAQQAADGAEAGTTLEIVLSQIGSVAPSRPLTRLLAIDPAPPG